MGIPELYNDETILLEAHNIKVKSVVFDAVLTSKRLILLDNKKGVIPPQEILIGTISTVDGGENAIRDPILTFTIIAKGLTTRQMIFTFPREASGERRRERDDWLRVIKERIAAFDHSTVLSGATAPDLESARNPDTPTPSYPDISGSSSQKKKVEISRPRRSIIDSVPSMPRPFETTTLPVGSFCSRCGNRVPPESVFCNRCGTPVAAPAEQPAVSSPAFSTPPVTSPPPAAPSAVPQVQIPTPPVFGMGAERKERTLEEVIHSIEPLIEDSVPRRSEPAPLVPRQYPAPPPLAETPAVETPAEVPPLADTPVQPVSGETVPAEASSTASPAPFLPVLPATTPVQPPRKMKFASIAVIAIVILAAIIGMVIFSNIAGTTPQAPAVTPAITPIPVVTTAAPTPVQTPAPVVTTPEVLMSPTTAPQLAVPPNGVWVRITYPGKFSGTYGTPGGQTSVADKDTGDQFFMISTINGPVVASIQKLDGSSDLLAIEVYKNGISMERKTTTAPKGIIDFQVDLRPPPTAEPTKTVNPTITPLETTAVNTSVTATA